MKKCENCGHINENDYARCISCGEVLPAEANMSNEAYKKMLAELGIRESVEEETAGKGWTKDDIQEMKKNLSIIKGCAIFFVAMALFGMIAGLLGYTQIMEGLQLLG